jgi:ATP-binding cassette subfamily F protein uup
MLAKLFLKPSNLLVMDEPTNDLDIETLELLEEQLLAYKGTLLLVSHDRAFLDNVVTSTYVLEGDGQVRLYPGGYADYLSQSAARREAAKKAAAQAEAAEKTAAPASAASASRKLSYKEQRELEALPGRIASLEEEVASLRATLEEGVVYRTEPQRAQEMTARLGAAEAELDAAVDRWAELEERRG